MPQTPIGLRLDDDLLRRVEEARGDVPRARWIAAALEQALGGSTRETSARLASTQAPDDLNAELAAIRSRKGLSLPDRIQLEGEARQRWGSQ